MAPLVQSYIDESLQLKAEVPELRFRDDGYLFGGEVDGQDVFQSARQKASSPPDVLVGPDSNPTLSFTSGSEGRPKGVLGRHYSLTRYYGWMAERFNLSSESRFTMLSGIAHDSVQRDIFTPLFLGAQLLVDKPNLPFPDVSERTEEASEEDLKNWESLTETERAVAQKWAELVRGLNPKTIRQDQSFFDLGGHSQLAQQLLLMTRKEFGVDISINLLYEFPTLSGFSGQIEKVKGGAGVDVEEGDLEYAKSYDELVEILADKYQAADA